MRSKYIQESLPFLPPSPLPLKFPLGLVSPALRPYLELIRLEKVSPGRRNSRELITNGSTAYRNCFNVLALR